MMNENKHIERIWNKYEEYQNGRSKEIKFLNQKICRNTKYLFYAKNISACIVMVMTTFIIASGVYAGTKILTKNRIDNQIQVEMDTWRNNEETTHVKKERIYYKKIDTYEEYKKYKEKNNNFIDMEQSEFEEYFLLFLYGRYYDRIGLYIKDLDITDTSIKINIGRNVEKDNDFVFIKMKKEDNRDEINVNFIPNAPNMTNYASMEEIPVNYSKEKAINDNCVVIEEVGIFESAKFINGKEMLKNFINEAENGISNNIRIVEYYYSESPEKMNFDIIDIEYINKKYIIGIRKVRSNAPLYAESEEYTNEDEYNEAMEYIYFETDKFEKYEYSSKYYYYFKEGEDTGLEWGFYSDK